MAHLGGMDRQCHGQAAANQDSSIEGAKEDIEVLTPRYKSPMIGGAIHRITHEQTAKEHNLSQEKGPHTEARCLVLLRRVVKLMGQRTATLSQHGWPPPACRRHTVVASPLALPQSCRLAVATASAIPDPLPPTGWGQQAPRSV